MTTLATPPQESVGARTAPAAAPRRRRRRAGRVTAAGPWTYLLLALTTLVSVFPLYWTMVAGSATNAEIAATPPPFLPDADLFTNIGRAMEEAPIGLAIVNSVIVAGCITVGTVLCCTLAGFAFAKLRFPGQNLLFLVLLSTMMIPTQAILVPQFRIVNSLGLIGTFWAVIIPNAAATFGIFLARQFMLAIPSELIEAARIDGAGTGRIFWSVVLPLSKPLLAVLTLLSLMYQWNDFLWPLIVLKVPELYTLTLGLQFLKGQYTTDYGALMAMSLISVAPLVILFLAFQRFFVQGLATTGIR